jgi:hypothetical protein
VEVTSSSLVSPTEREYVKAAIRTSTWVDRFREGEPAAESSASKEPGENHLGAVSGKGELAASPEYRVPVAPVIVQHEDSASCIASLSKVGGTA